MAKVLIVGVPRSGTTWVGRMLSAEPGVHYDNEPDSTDYPLTAVVLGRNWFPALAPGEEAPLVRLMWDVFFRGGWGTGPGARLAGALLPRLPVPVARAGVAALGRSRLRHPAPAHTLIKSVRATLCLEWLEAEQAPAIVVVLAHPLNILSSWLRLGWEGWPTNRLPALTGPMAAHGLHPPDEGRRVEAVTWTICAQQAILLETLARHPGWQRVVHERLCLEPAAGFAAVAAATGLPWTARAEETVAASNADGGSTYEVRRLTAEQVDRWRRLSADELAAARPVVADFAAHSEVFAASLEAPEWAGMGAAEAPGGGRRAG